MQCATESLTANGETHWVFGQAAGWTLLINSRCSRAAGDPWACSTCNDSSMLFECCLILPRFDDQIQSCCQLVWPSFLRAFLWTSQAHSLRQEELRRIHLSRATLRRCSHRSMSVYIYQISDICSVYRKNLKEICSSKGLWRSCGVFCPWRVLEGHFSKQKLSFWAKDWGDWGGPAETKFPRRWVENMLKLASSPHRMDAKLEIEWNWKCEGEQWSWNQWGNEWNGQWNQAIASDVLGTTAILINSACFLYRSALFCDNCNCWFRWGQGRGQKGGATTLQALQKNWCQYVPIHDPII